MGDRHSGGGCTSAVTRLAQVPLHRTSKPSTPPMQFSPIEIKEKLTRALDDQNNVSDIQAVLEVIAALESYPITREALEQTRIGKLVNDLRKKTTNDDLARRAKKLVRSWQKLISPSDNNSINGERINTNSMSPGMMTVYSGAGSQPVSPASFCCSPALSKSSPRRITVSNKIHSPCLRLNATPGTPGLHPVSPKVDPNGIQRSNISPNSVCLLRVGPLTSTPKGSNLAPKNMCPRRVGTPSSSTPKEHSPNMSLSSTPTSKGNCPNLPFGNSASNEGRCENNYQKNEPCSPAGCDRNCVSKEKTSLSKVGSLHLGKCSPISNHSKDRINAGVVNDQKKNSVKGNLSKKRTLNDPGGGPPAKRVPPPEKYVAKDLHSKEKTLNGMCPNLESSSEKKKSNEVLAKSKSVMDNCFMYVSGDSNDSFKNSASKRNLTVKQDKTKTSKVKTTAQLIAELQAKSGSSSHLKGDVIEKIRANQIKRESSNNILPSDLKSNKRDCRQPHNMLSKAKNELVQKFLQTSVRPNDIKEESESPLSMEMDPCRLQLDCVLPGGGRSLAAAHGLAPMSANQQSLLDLYNSLPPLNLDQINWDEDEYEVPKRTEPVTDGDIERLHSEQWSGVNGMRDSVGMWRDWTQAMSAESLDGSRLELLPYVNIDI